MKKHMRTASKQKHARTATLTSQQLATAIGGTGGIAVGDDLTTGTSDGPIIGHE